MKIAVVGNCQVVGMAVGLCGLLPDAEIYPIQPAVERMKKRLEASAENVISCDLLFTHGMDQECYGPLRASALRSQCRQIYALPSIAFTGYQPDMTYLRHAGKEFDSPVGNYHSRIVLAAFRLGYDEATTVELFNALVMRSLGYHDDFEQSYNILRTALLRHEFDLDAEFAFWHRQPFMHTINHPNVHILSALVRRCAINAGAIGADAPRATPIYDPLAFAAVWPVYPPLARGRDVQGSYLFKRHERLVAADGGPITIGLERFVRDSFAFYRTVPEEAFASDEIARAAEKIKDVRRGAIFSFASNW